MAIQLSQPNAMVIASACSLLAGVTITVALYEGLEKSAARPLHDPQQSALSEPARAAAREAEPSGSALGPKPAAADSALDESLSLPQLRKRYRQLQARYDASTRELTTLRQRLAMQAESAAPLERPRRADPRHDSGNPLALQFYPLGKQELTELVSHCGVRVDQPPLMDSTPGTIDDAGERIGATAQEVRVLQQSLAAVHRDFTTRLRALYEEAVGHAPAEDLAPRALLGEIQDKTAEGEPAQLMARVARERAGLDPPPDDLRHASAYERAERMYLGLGDEFQRVAGRQLGTTRAHQLRAKAGGWPWRRTQFDGCGKSE